MTIDAQTKSESLIRVVDDDEGMLAGMQFLLKCKGWKSVGYSSAEAFLSQDDYRISGCLLLDIRMPGLSGIELQLEMIRREIDLPVVIMTGHADVDTAVKTLKMGALDFLKKPVKADELERVLGEVFSKAIARSAGVSEKDAVGVWMNLTEREREIMRLTAQGLTSKAAGERLGLSARTVEGHRLGLFKKFGIHSKKELAACLSVISEKMNGA